jgi:hypothetical protein
LWLANASAADRNPAMELGLGVGVLGGGSGGGYGVGASQRAGLDIPAGPVHSVILSGEHAHHRLLDAQSYFSDAVVPEDALVGGRDRWSLNLGARFQLPLAAPSEDRVVVEPLIEIGVGFVATHTQVIVPGFAGRTRLGSWNTAPALNVGLGADLRLRRFLSLVPAVRVATSLQQDAAEQGGPASFGAEVRGDLSLSARVTW